jgi:hypothetical protein
VTTTTAAARCTGDHARTEERVRQLEGRADKQEGETKELRELATSVDKSLSNIQGQITGALAASKVSGAVIGALVSAGASLAIGLVFFLLKKGGQ